MTEDTTAGADGREAMSGDEIAAELRTWLEDLADDTVVPLKARKLRTLLDERERLHATVERQRAANEADADAYEAGLLQVHSDRDYWQDETVKATARADQAEAEVKRYRSFCGEALCGDVERDRDRLQAAINRVLVRMIEYDNHGSDMVNVRQVINLLSPTWPDGNYSNERGDRG